MYDDEYTERGYDWLRKNFYIEKSRRQTKNLQVAHVLTSRTSIYLGYY